jgi:nucleoside-diphosphate-sugar epimerase
MNYLVLGSSGQIGSQLVNFLIERGKSVDTFDIVDDSLEDLRIKDNELLQRKIQKSDFIFFLAFDVGGSRYLSKYQHTFDFLQNNIKLMSNTFDCLKKHQKPFIFASSQMSNMSYSPYGVAKAVGERFTDSLGGLVVKFWNVYGPEKDLDKAHVITDFILKAKNSGVIDMMTDGTEVRQFLHADDCSRCLLIMSEQFESLDKEKEYHITNFKWNSIKEIAEIIAAAFENAHVIPAKSKDVVQKDKRNEPDEYILNFWNPEIDIEEGIKMIIEQMEKIK